MNDDELVNDVFRSAIAIAYAIHHNDWEGFGVLMNTSDVEGVFVAGMQIIGALVDRVAANEDLTCDESWQLLRDAIEMDDDDDE